MRSEDSYHAGCLDRRSQLAARACSLVVLMLLGLMTTGCTAARVERPVVLDYDSDTAEAQIGFWHALAEEPRVSNDDAFHGLLLLADGADEAEDYAQRVELLKSRGWLADSFDGSADTAVTRGDVARAITQILEIKGGLTMRLFGPVPRYAMRELMYQRLYPPSSVRQTFTGTEYLAVIARVEDYRGRQAYLEAEKQKQLEEEAVAEQEL